MKTIASRDNAAFKALARLAASAAERRRQGYTVIEGAHLVEACLDAARREALALAIRENALAWAVATATVAEIDGMNVLQANLAAMARAIEPSGLTARLTSWMRCQ